MKTELLLIKLIKFLELREVNSSDGSTVIVLTEDERQALIILFEHLQKTLDYIGKSSAGAHKLKGLVEKSKDVITRDLNCYYLVNSEIIQELKALELQKITKAENFVYYLDKFLQYNNVKTHKKVLSFYRCLYSHKMKNFILKHDFKDFLEVIIL